jgi:hypothetical protein
MLVRVVVLFLLTESRCVLSVASLLSNLILLPIHGPPERASFSTQISVRTDKSSHPTGFMGLCHDDWAGKSFPGLPKVRWVRHGRSPRLSFEPRWASQRSGNGPRSLPGTNSPTFCTLCHQTHRSARLLFPFSNVRSSFHLPSRGPPRLLLDLIGCA